MDVEFFIHGVPQGQKIWGKTDDINYLNNFYNKQATDEDTKFLIEAHSVKNKDYYYYSYLKYKNVVNSEGRPGAYFGMTLRFDQYCSNVIGVHQLLDILYNKYVVNNLLIEEANKIKFAVSDFKAKDEEIKKIEKESLELLRIIFNSNDFSLKRSDRLNPLEVKILRCSAIKDFFTLHCGSYWVTLWSADDL